MRKIFLISILAILLLMPAWGRWQKQYIMLTANINIAAGATAVIVTDFASPARPCDKYDYCALTVTFARAAGAADTVDIDVEIHNGSEWSLLAQYNGDPLIQVPTNTDAFVGTTVRMTYIVNLAGAKYIRIGSIENTDGVNNITAFNVRISM